jgi:hypothetical protein
MLTDETGGSANLGVIDVSAGGAALCNKKDGSQVPRGKKGPLTKGRIKMRVPALSRRNAKRDVTVGTYHVVRDWSPGPGDEAGVAIRFDDVRSEWKKLLANERFAHTLRNAKKS